YLALVQEICTQVARDPDAQRNVTVGQPLLAHLPPRLYGKTVGLLPPGVERPVPLAVSAADGLVGVTYAHTDRAGFYKLLVDAGEPQPEGQQASQMAFAVNVPSRESDVRRLSADELRQAFPGFDFAYQRGDVRRQTTQSSARGGELWRWLAYTLLGLVLLESILAQRFGK
ncbi:hypothetical protein HQ576_18795, partial [bacterium]|nr:hypothetical protein [bacterium]